MKTLIATIALALGPVLSMAGSLRCGSQLIMPGSSSAELAALCGEPTQVDHGSLYNGASGVTRTANGIVADGVQEVSLETWTYNFGPNQLMERIRIENGLIVSIDSLGYGYNEP